jgi:hypothetical protein
MTLILNSRLTIGESVSQCHKADMAKLRPAKHFLRPLKPTLDKLLDTILYENSKSRSLYGFKISWFFLICAARSTFYLMNLARELKSLATPAIKIFFKGPTYLKSNQILTFLVFITWKHQLRTKFWLNSMLGNAI